MKRFSSLVLFCVFLTTSCSGVNSVIKKPYQNHETSLSITDLTAKSEDFMDAGVLLRQALEKRLESTNYILINHGSSSKYQLKYQVVEYKEGSRVARSLMLGAVSKLGKARLKIKAALFNGKKMLGRWDVESWLEDGLLGGSEKTLFVKAADEIVDHLQGDY
ncbi:MAG: hypothetical protein ACE5GQ_01160 [Nitrospinales bacterium]